MSEIEKAKAKLMLASFDLGQAQRALEDAENIFSKAIKELDFLEDQARRDARILSPSDDKGAA